MHCIWYYGTSKGVFTKSNFHYRTFSNSCNKTKYFLQLTLLLYWPRLARKLLKVLNNLPPKLRRGCEREPNRPNVRDVTILLTNAQVLVLKVGDRIARQLVDTELGQRWKLCESFWKLPYLDLDIVMPDCNLVITGILTSCLHCHCEKPLSGWISQEHS